MSAAGVVREAEKRKKKDGMVGTVLLSAQQGMVLTPLLCLVHQAKRSKQRRTKRATADQQVCVSGCEPV